MTQTRDNIFMYFVLEELERIRERHGPLSSCHEGIGVLLEEFEELKEEVWKKAAERRDDLLISEAVQVAAVAVQFCSDLCSLDSEATAYAAERAVLLRDQAVKKCDELRDRTIRAEQESARLRSQVDELRAELCSALGDETLKEGTEKPLWLAIRRLVDQRGSLASSVLQASAHADYPEESLEEWARKAEIPF